MKTYFITIFLCIMLLTACTPTPTSTPVAELPETTPSATITDTPLPQGETIIIDDSADSGSGTLRQALENAQPYDTIIFDPNVFAPDSPATISVTSELPHIRTNHLTIDASNAGVILDGSSIETYDVTGLNIASDGNIVRGLQIISFTGFGIQLQQGSDNNLIGGDQDVGTAPLGQGNLISGNGSVGIGMFNASNNTIKGNYIGTDLTGLEGQGNQHQGIFIWDGSNNQIINNLICDNGASGVTLQGAGADSNILSGNTIGTNETNGAALGNHNNGIEIGEGASDNFVGPGNVIAHNDWSGVSVYGADSLSNTLTQNRIYHNGWLGIDVWGGANLELTRPVITAFNLSDGIVEGIAYPNAEIDTFSTENDEGDIFEGNVTADETGYFALNKGTSLSGPHIVVTATDSAGNTSEFSLPTFGETGSLNLQHDNSLPISLLESMQSVDLEDNRIASWWNSLWGYYPLTELLDEARYMGAKRFRFAINGGEADAVEWDKPEFSIDPTHDAFISSLADNNIQMTYNLIFWDMETWPGGDGAPCPRFKTEEDILHYLDYVRFAVRHFRDRVQYYEIWNEPDNTACPQWIQPEDYINLVRRTVPVIREEYPEAKIQVGSIILSGNSSQTYLFHIIKSDIMPLVDVISWHPFYGDSPEQSSSYYYAYPSIVQNIKDTAHAYGFTGEFEADEIVWRPHSNPENEPNRLSYGEIAHTKYWLRGILMNLGMNVTAGNLRIPHSMATASFAVRNLSTIMPGNEPASISVMLETEELNVSSYGFALPNGDRLLALWNDGVAADYDPGMLSTLVLPGRAGQIAIGIDVLYGYEQELVVTTDGEDLIINDLLIRDYPLIIRLSDDSSS